MKMLGGDTPQKREQNEHTQEQYANCEYLSSEKVINPIFFDCLSKF